MGMRKKINEAVDWASVMEDNNRNIDRLAKLKTEVSIDPVMEEVIDETEKSDKNAEKVFKEISKNSKDVTPENPDTGKKINIKPYTEKLNLDESLFMEESEDEAFNDNENYDESLEEKKENTKKKHICEEYNTREYTDRLFDMVENDMLDDKTVLKSLMYWISEDDIHKFMKLNDLLWDEDDEDDEDIDESLEKKSLDEDWVLEPGKEYTSKSGNKIIIKSVIPYVSEYDGSAFIKIDYDYELVNGKTGSSTCNEKDFFNMLIESKTENLMEYVEEDQVEDDDYTVYDLLNDRLFGYGLNKSNFRLKWKFAEVEPIIKTKDGKTKRSYFYPTIHADEIVTGKNDDRRAFVDEGIGVFVYDEDEASLAKKCAEELNLDFVLKKLIRPHNGFNYIATIKVSDDVQEMPIKDYVESIGKSMNDFLRGKGEKVRSNFKDSANYKFRKDRKENK